MVPHAPKRSVPAPAKAPNGRHGHSSSPARDKFCGSSDPSPNESNAANHPRNADRIPDARPGRRRRGGTTDQSCARRRQVAPVPASPVRGSSYCIHAFRCGSRYSPDGLPRESLPAAQVAARVHAANRPETRGHPSATARIRALWAAPVSRRAVPAALFPTQFPVRLAGSEAPPPAGRPRRCPRRQPVAAAAPPWARVCRFRSGSTVTAPPRPAHPAPQESAPCPCAGGAPGARELKRPVPGHRGSKCPAGGIRRRAGSMWESSLLENNAKTANLSTQTP